MDVYGEADKIRHKLKNCSFQELDEREQIILSIIELETEVNNGGFDQFYFNTSGDYAYFVPDALQRIGAFKAADIAARANDIFGSNIPKDRPTRQDIHQELTNEDDEPWEELDSEFYSYPDNISQLLETFLSS